MQLLPSEIDLGFLENKFPTVKFYFLQSSDAENFISCFIAQFSTNDECANNWRKITNQIALYFQEGLSNTYASWNIYLALVTPSPVEKHLKYKIENDKFALRKLVLSDPLFYADESSSIVSILENSILGKDLELGAASESVLQEEGSNIVREYLAAIADVPSDAKEASIQIRKNMISDLLERF